MTRALTCWTAAALLAAGVGLAASAPRSPACVSERLFGVRATLFMLATARDDTVRAGPGPIQYNAGDTSRLESIHGQRFRIDRLGGDVPAELAGATEAVLVSYGSECRETWRWREARWARPGEQVLIDASLRPRGQWAGGLPTFDVGPVHGLYPEGYTRAMDSIPADLLTRAQVFELTRLLPTFEEAEAAPDSAYAPLLAWARANPLLAARFPATRALDEAHDALQPCRPAYDPHPVAGTYRATVVAGGADTVTVYFRTDARGYPVCGPPAPRLDRAVLRPRLADTARLYVYGAADEATIPEADAWNSAGSCGVGTIDVVNRPRADRGGRGWEADFHLFALSRCFPGHPGVRRVGDALSGAYVEGRSDDAPGWFSEGEGGGMRFRQAWRVDGRVMLEVRAERVSPRVVPLR